MKRACLAFVILMTCALAGPAIRAQQLPITSLREANGPADSWVRRIVNDSHGWLWFCTNEGLSRFDGDKFTNFGTREGLPDARVSDLLETQTGTYWLATGTGVVSFDPKGTPMFTLVPWPDGRNRAGSADVLRQSRDGTIRVGGEDGLFVLRLDGGRVVLSPVNIGLPETASERQVNAVLEDRSGNLWVGAPSGLYRRWPDGSFARYTTSSGLPEHGDWVQHVFESRAGNLWAGTREGGFFRFTPDSSRRTPAVDRHHTELGLQTSWIWQLFETQDGRFWVATNKGAVAFTSEAATAGRQFERYGRRNGVPDPGGPALAEDIAGNLWMGTWTAGAMKLAASGLTTYGERDGIVSVGALFEDRTGRVCYRGDVVGFYPANRSVFEGARVPLVGPQQSSSVQRIGCFDGQAFDAFWPGAIRGLDWLDGWNRDGVTLQTRRGDWWVASGDGLYHFPEADRLDALRTAVPLAVYSHRNGLSARQARRLFEDSAGAVWISTIGKVGETENGLARWDPTSGTLQNLAGSPGLPPVATSLAIAFAEDAAGGVWIGFNGVLARYRNGSFQTFDASDGVPIGNVRVLYRDRAGTMWIASEKSGLIRMTVPEAGPPAFSVFGIEHGLSSNNLTVIVDDLAGHIYTGGANGVDRFDPLTARVTHVTPADGLAPGALRSALRDRHGVLWFGTTLGLTRVVPASPTAGSASIQTSAPPVFLTAVEVDGVSHALSAIGETDVTVPMLDPGQHGILISFSGVRFVAGEVLRYQFRLGGRSTEWSTPAPERSVTFANLPGGGYEFLVRAVAPDGSVSATPARVSFSILRPVWQRPWFVALAIVVLAFGARAAYRIRVANLLHVANMRTRIASDLHDDIGANLTRIALLSDAAPAATPDSRDAAIGRIARESVSAMSDIVWAIKPEREGLADLTRRMRQQADDLFVPRDVTLRFNAPPAAAETRLDIDVRRDVLLFFKEAVTNVARHASCRNVAIDLLFDRSQLTLKIADDGVGFDPSIDRDGQGLRSLRRRAARLRADLAITSSPGHGTVVSLTVPL